MKLSDILAADMVLNDLAATTKDEVLAAVSDHMATHGDLGADASQILDALTHRERLGSTGVGGGVAIPHAKIPGLTQLTACLARSKTGIPFNSLDEQPVSLLFVLLVPENSAGLHLKALARVSRLLRDAAFKKKLRSQRGAEDLYNTFIAQDELQ